MNISDKYFLASGLFSLFLSIAHAWWGIRNAFNGIVSLSEKFQASLEISWYQVGGVLFVGGIALLGRGIGRLSGRSIPYLILAIYLMNFFVSLVLILSKYPDLITLVIPQLILYCVMLILLILGIRTADPTEPF